VYNKEWVV